MNLNQDAKIGTMRAFLHLGSRIQPGVSAPFQYFAELARPFIRMVKGIRFEGLLGSTEDSRNPAFKESKRVAYEIKETLGIRGFVLNLAGSASLATGLPA